MDPVHQVFEAAVSRASGLADGDEERLRSLLHASFRWTSHTGESFDLDAYVASNTRGHTKRHAQKLLQPEVIVVDEWLCCAPSSRTPSLARAGERLVACQ